MSEKHGVLYFKPGELLFHVSRQGPVDVQELIKWANNLAAPKGITLLAPEHIIEFNTGEEGPYFKKQRSVSASQTKAPPIVVGPQKGPILRFPPYRSPKVKIPPPFSLVFAPVESSRWMKLPVPTGPEPRLNLEPEQVEALMQAQKELFDLAHFLDQNRKSAPVQLEVVSLNWLASSAPPKSEPGGTGGPGGEPQHVTNADIGKYHIFPTSTSLPAVFNTVSQAGAGNGVAVAMLDTAYDEKTEIPQIYNKWVRNVTPPQTPHPILQALLGPNKRLTVYNDDEARDYLPGLMIDNYDYVMNSHGLHGAGIINSLAPAADIYIYQTLNKYGLTDEYLIAKNMAKILADLGDRPLVVNASLTLRKPEEEGHLQEADDYGLGQFILNYRPPFLIRLICWIICWIFEWLLHLPCPGFCESWLERQARPVEWICDLVYATNSRVIAAAGNDGRAGYRPPALYPAASESVVGVGALGTNGAPAPYSNLADQPPITGITTLGGDATKGILGAYADPFPDGRPNDNGWGRWHGTSFATDVISGITAAVLSNLITANPSTTQTPSTEDAIAALYNAQSSRTRATEDVFAVEQR